jgi:hypothetical protein
LQGITYLKLGLEGATVGMSGLEIVFEQLATVGRRPEEAGDEELLGMARASNWISSNPDVEAKYVCALCEAYAAFLARRGGPGSGHAD